MIGHTPGPWKVFNAGKHWNNKAIDNLQIQYGNDGECISDHVYEMSDALLISAAPDLLQALKMCASVLSGDDMTKGQLVKALESARLAIKKTKGE